MIAKLSRNEMWSEFASHGTEMIITKKGRNMFPYLEYKFSGLDPNGVYRTSLQFMVMDDKKYKFSAGKWEQFEPCDDYIHHPREVFLGGNRSGADLMQRGVSFQRLKITNDKDFSSPEREIVRLQSMRKYMPVLTVYRVTEHNQPIVEGQFRFENTMFIGVTAYQNSAVKDLKVVNNKYAQGFREGVRKRTSTSPCSSDDVTSNFSTTPPNKRQKLSPEVKPQLEVTPTSPHQPVVLPADQQFQPAEYHMPPFQPFPNMDPSQPYMVPPAQMYNHCYQNPQMFNYDLNYVNSYNQFMNYVPNYVPNYQHS